MKHRACISWLLTLACLLSAPPAHRASAFIVGSDLQINSQARISDHLGSPYQFQPDSIVPSPNSSQSLNRYWLGLGWEAGPGGWDAANDWTGLAGIPSARALWPGSMPVYGPGLDSWEMKSFIEKWKAQPSRAFEDTLKSAAWISLMALPEIGPVARAAAAGRVSATFVVPRMAPFAAMSGTALARELGRVGEQAAGIIKNTERIPSLTGTANYRIPDVLDRARAPGIIGDVKNVAQLSYSKQLRDFSAFAQQNGLRFELTVRRNTRLSAPLQQAVSRGEIVLKYLP